MTPERKTPRSHTLTVGHIPGQVCPPGTKCDAVRCQNAGREPLTPDDEMLSGSEPATPTSTDNYTCIRCGNTKLCTHTDTSCWKCGEPVIK
jgi:hypothetical protein